MTTTHFNKIVFDHASHSYKLGDVEFVSVTTLLSRVKPSFDSDFVSRQMALRNQKTQSEILEEWRVKGDIARDKGTRVHTFVEDVLQNRVDPILYNVNELLPEMIAFRKFWEKFATQFQAKVLRQEYTVGDLQYGVAGRLDLLVKAVVDGREVVYIMDWKTGKIKSSNPYEQLLPPFQDLQNCELELYSLQTSLYRLMIEKNIPALQIADSYLVHLQPDGSYHMLRAKDYRERLAKWLENGIPTNLFGDPASTAKLESLTETLRACDYKLLSRVSDLSLDAFANLLLDIQGTVRKIRSASDV